MTTALLYLAKRQLLGGDDDDSSSSSDEEGHCPTNFDEMSHAQPILNDDTFHDIITYTAAACTAATLLVGGYLILGQMFNYRVPRIQKHIIRIILTAPLFAIFSLVGTASYRATHYMEALLGFYEVFTLYSLFMLCVEYLAPSPTWEGQLAVFHNPTYGGIKNFRSRYIRVVQVIPLRLMGALATIISTARECWMNSESRRISGIFTIISTVSVIVAITSILPFISKMTPELKKVDPHIVNKLLAAKVIIVAEIILALVFRILSWTDSLNPSDVISYNDINVGMLVFATNCLSLITALVMLPFYRAVQFSQSPWVVDFHHQEGSQGHQYTAIQDEHQLRASHEDTTPPDYATAGNDAGAGPDKLLPLQSMQAMPKRSPARAVLDTVNVLDVGVAVWRGVKLLFMKKRKLGVRREGKYSGSS